MDRDQMISRTTNLPAITFLFLFITIRSSTTYSDTLVTANTTLIQATPELLKRGLWGTVTGEVEIDTSGTPNNLSLSVLSGNPSFDSLVRYRILSDKFTHAIDNDQTILYSVGFEMSVPLDSLLEQCLLMPPCFSGTIFDSVTQIPVNKARIRVTYSDTTEDSTLTIGFNQFLSIVQPSNFLYDGISLITTTDSLGRFNFRLLPSGHITVAVQASGYENRRFKCRISNGQQHDQQYLLQPLVNERTAIDSNYVITVQGRNTLTESNLTVNNEELRIGFSPLLSNIIQTKAEIRRVPEGPSMMLVRSGCPYDNVYLVDGIPMLAPFHFGGYPYADVDGIMISSVPRVNVLINDIAAKRVDASGCIVEAKPGKITYDKDPIGKGFYVKGDFSMLAIDLIGAYASSKNPGDYIQLGYSTCNQYILAYNKMFYSSVSLANQGIGIPLYYGNAALSGSKSIGPLQLSTSGWVSWDAYEVGTSTATKPYNGFAHYNSDKTIYPWGMASVTLKNSATKYAVTIGGAHQFFVTGKQINASEYTTCSFLNNGDITIDMDTIVNTPVSVKLSFRGNYNEWSGYAYQKTSGSVDTLINQSGTEKGVHINTSVIKQTGHVTTTLDLLGSLIAYPHKPYSIADAGITVLYDRNDYTAGLHLGRVTSRPDIRGLPNPDFRKQINHTYIASLPGFVRYGKVTRFGIEPYIRYGTNTPQLDPVTQCWNPGKTTPVLAQGADIDCRIVLTSWIDFSTAINLANAHRLDASDNPLDYEWNLPWTFRTSLHLSAKGGLFHFYIDYLHSKGLPYYDINSDHYSSLPMYRSLDLNVQFRPTMPRQRYINKLDGYVTIKNVQDLLVTNNIRDYFWRNEMRQPIYLGYGRVDMGARFGFRL